MMCSRGSPLRQHILNRLPYMMGKNKFFLLFLFKPTGLPDSINNVKPRYLDFMRNNNNLYFKHMVGQIYPTELQLNTANYSNTEAQCLDLTLVQDEWHGFI